MKLGTFVGKKGVSLTDAEIKELTDAVKAAADIVGLTSSGFEYTASTPKIGDVTYLLVEYRTVNPKTYKDSGRNHVMPMNIHISVYKDKGYDENEEGRFTQWNADYMPELKYTSFQCFVELSGCFRKFHSSVVHHNVGIHKRFFDYGTEISDLRFENGLYSIVEYLASCTQERDRYKKRTKTK